MGLFDFLRNDNEVEVRSDTTTSGSTAFTSMFSTSEVITYWDLIKIPTAKVCLDLISGTIAQMPIYLYRENPDGSVDRIKNDKREFLLNNEANEFEDGYFLKREMAKNHIVYGISYVFMDRVGNEITSLHVLENTRVALQRYYKKNAFLSDIDYYYSGNGGAITLKDYEIIKVVKESHNDGTGIGVLKSGKQIINIIKGENQYIENIYNNGALPVGLLQTEGRLTKPVADGLRAAWQSIYGGVRNAGKVVVLEEGLKYQPLTLNPDDLQLTEIKKEHQSEICKLFNVPESMVIADANKYGSLEQNNIYFLQYCLSPILAAIESGLNKSMLLEVEKQEGLFFAFDTSEILRTTEQEKFSTIKTGLDSGALSINEARSKLNLPAIKDDIMKWSLGNVLYNPKTGEMMIPNTGAGIVNGENTNDLPKAQQTQPNQTPLGGTPNE